MSNKGRFGVHGGQYIPETLMNAVIELEAAYEHYKKESEIMLKKYKGEVLEASIMAKTMAKMKLNFDIMKDNSDSKIADILTRGFTMGTIDMNKKIDEYKKSADKNVLKLAKEFLEFQNKNIELLKEYL